MSQIDTLARDLQAPTVRLQVRDLLIWMAIAAAAFSRRHEFLAQPPLSRQIEGSIIFLRYSGAVAASISMAINRCKKPSLRLTGGHVLVILEALLFAYQHLLPSFALNNKTWFWQYGGVVYYFSLQFAFMLSLASLAFVLTILCRLNWIWRIVTGARCLFLFIFAFVILSQMKSEIPSTWEKSSWYDNMPFVHQMIGQPLLYLMSISCVVAILIDLRNQRYGDWAHWMEIIVFLLPVLSMIVNAIIR